MHPEAAEQKQKGNSLNGVQRQGQLVESIEQLEHELTKLQKQRTSTPHHVDWDALPADDKFERLAPSRKRLTDTVKSVSYRG